MAGKLFCFDFDETITNAHMHAYCFRQWQQDPNRPQIPGAGRYDIAAFLNESGGIKNKAALEETFRRIFANKDKIAITSFSYFPLQIKAVLQQLNIFPYDINQISVVAGYPTQEGKPSLLGGDPNHPDCKEQHIRQAIQLSGLQNIQRRDVILVDDSQRNIQHAKQQGHIAIQVPKQINPNPGYLRAAIDISSSSHQKQNSQKVRTEGEQSQQTPRDSPPRKPPM